MTMNDSFWRVHEDLPRQSPGSDCTTQLLLDLATENCALGAAIDMGCGPGRSALLLAAEGLDVVAIDTHEPFLAELRTACSTSDAAGRVTAVNMAMEDIDFPDASFDLVWAESTAYLIGWFAALTRWKRLLKPGGKLVATGCFWLTDRHSAEATEFWHTGGAVMITVEQAVRLAGVAGYRVDHTYLQPDSDWFAEYYDPLAERLDQLKCQLESTADAELHAAIERTELEIRIRREHADEYGHAGFVLSS